MDVRLHALGECAIETQRGRIGPESKLAFAMGLYFILERGKPIPRQAVIDLFWPDAESESHARHRFRQGILRLKQLGIPVESRQGHVLLDRARAGTDFDSLLAVNGDAESALRERASFEFLPGYIPRYSRDLEAWLEMHRGLVQTAIERVFIHALEAARQRGDWQAVERLAADFLRVDPFNEEATMARAEATVMRGSKVQALAILDSYIDALGEKSVSLGLPAKILRSRIADRLNQPKYATLSERHFVGRENEVENLTRLLENARSSRGGARLLWGEPGIGKTRLLTEISRIADLKGIRVAAARCQAIDLDRPLSVFTDIVPILRALPGALGVPSQSWTLLQRLAEHTEKNASATPFGVDAGETSAATRRALFDLFEAVSEENTLLFTVEDVHWADQHSWSVLETLAEWASRRRIVVLLTSRMHRRQAGADAAGDAAPAIPVRQLWPLTPTNSEVLMARLADEQSAALPDEMRQWCVSVAEGNPFYLRELLTRWLETHEPFGVPESLSALINRRLERLTRDALHLLQACVALGSACTLERLDRMEETRGPGLLLGLEELAAANMIVCDGDRIHVKHELLAQAAWARLSEPAARLIHRRVAQVIQAELSDDPVPALFWECAHHWEKAGEAPKAVSLLDECGRHLIRVGLPQEAVALYRKGLEFKVPDFQQELLLREGLIAALRASGLWQQVVGAAAAFRKAAQACHHPLKEHSALELVGLEANYRLAGDTESTLRSLKVCLAAEHATPAHRLNAGFWLLAVANNWGFADDALAAWKTAAPLVNDSNVDPIARHQFAMVYHADHGDLDEAVHHARLLVDYAKTGEDPMVLVRAARNAATALRRAGHCQESKLLLKDAYDLAHKYHAHHGRADVAQQLASLLIQEGDLLAASVWLHRAEESLSKCESAIVAFDVQLTRLKLAILVGDDHAAANLVRELPEWRNDPFLRRRQDVVSLLLLAATGPSPVQDRDELLAACEATYNVLKRRGHQDTAVHALATTYFALGNGRKAHQVLASYLLTDRRDRGPIPPPLQALAAKCRIGIKRRYAGTRVVPVTS